MIYRTPALSKADRDVLDLIDRQRRALRFYVNQNPTRWTGFLRRNTFARAIQGSNSIEGYNATESEAVEIVDDEKPEDILEETLKALTGYRNAMTYVLQVHDDPHFELHPQVLKSLHFMMINYDLTKLPGQWRHGSIWVVHEPSGETVYEGPPGDMVPGLMDELVNLIKDEIDVPPMVRAAMAHLNLTMIHPFKDGNGRMARALQTLVLAREGLVTPVFCSIEEWLGRNTTPYYDILAQVGQGAWNPHHDAGPWLRFCLRAHYQQAATLIRRNEEIGSVWRSVTDIIAREKLPERVELALMDAAYGYRVRNRKYRADNEISDVVASRDLKRLCDVGLLQPVGEKRGRYYVATEELRSVRERVRIRRREPDPYTLVDQTEREPYLPGLSA